MPIRNSIRWSCGTSVFCLAMPRWISTAQRAASTALANSTSMPSPVVLTIRPRCTVMAGSTSAFRNDLSCASVPSSSRPIKRLYPATSAASTAASRRSTCSLLKMHPRGSGKLNVHVAQLWADVRQCPRPKWVKLRKTQCEQMPSGLPLKADIAQYNRHVSKVPNPDIPVLFVGTSEDRRRDDEGECLALRLNDDL